MTEAITAAAETLNPPAQEYIDVNFALRDINGKCEIQGLTCRMKKPRLSIPAIIGNTIATGLKGLLAQAIKMPTKDHQPFDLQKALEGHQLIRRNSELPIGKIVVGPNPNATYSVLEEGTVRSYTPAGLHHMNATNPLDLFLYVPAEATVDKTLNPITVPGVSVLGQQLTANADLRTKLIDSIVKPTAEHHPFDAEKALDGHPLIMRNGTKVIGKVTKTAGGIYPFSLIAHQFKTFTKEGRFKTNGLSPEDLFLFVPETTSRVVIAKEPDLLTPITELVKAHPGHV